MAESDNTSVEFFPGEVLFKENDSSGYLYIIKEGQVGLFKKGPQNEDLPIAVIGSGEFLGEMSLINQENRSATAVALSPVKAVKMTKKSFQDQVDKTPKWIQALLLGLVQRLYRTDEILRRHGVVDQKIDSNIKAIQAKFTDKKDVA